MEAGKSYTVLPFAPIVLIAFWLMLHSNKKRVSFLFVIVEVLLDTGVCAVVGVNAANLLPSQWKYVFSFLLNSVQGCCIVHMSEAKNDTTHIQSSESVCLHLEKIQQIASV